MTKLYFDGITKGYLRLREGLDRGDMPEVEQDFVSVDGRDGAISGKKKLRVRRITVPATVNATNLSLNDTKEDLMNWLYKDKPEVLYFSDQTDRIYYAELQDISFVDITEKQSKCTILFLCSDPYKYAPTESSVIKDEGKGDTNVNAITVVNSGNKETKPRVKLKIKKNATFIAVGDGENINLIGNPLQVEDIPFVREERKFWHEMGTTVGWTKGTTVEGGVDAGVMTTNGYEFLSYDFGSGSKWHGPALKTSLSTSIQDFQIDALVSQRSTTGQIGSIEVCLLDVNNKIVTKMIITKRATNSQANWVRLRCGNDANGYDMINSRGAYENTWANFDGMLRVGRIGNYWYCLAGLIDSTGKMHTRMWFDWTDYNNLYTLAPVTQVQVQLWQSGTYPVTTQRIKDIKVYKINTQSEQVPYVALVDDEIEFDHQSGKIWRNGEEIIKEKAFAGNFFPLNKGVNTLLAEPSEAIKSMDVRWRNKWL